MMRLTHQLIVNFVKGGLGLGSADTKQESPNRYSYGGANSHKSCVDQGDRWIIKFRLSLTYST